jgi:hypothetical protein
MISLILSLVVLGHPWATLRYIILGRPCVPVFFLGAKSAQIHSVRQLKSADVCYESGHFLPPRKKLTDSNTFTLGIFGLPCASLGMLGRAWASLGYIGRPWVFLGYIRLAWTKKYQISAEK